MPAEGDAGVASAAASNRSNALRSDGDPSYSTPTPFNETWIVMRCWMSDCPRPRAVQCAGSYAPLLSDASPRLPPIHCHESPPFRSLLAMTMMALCSRYSRRRCRCFQWRIRSRRQRRRLLRHTGAARNNQTPSSKDRSILFSSYYGLIPVASNGRATCNSMHG